MALTKPRLGQINTGGGSLLASNSTTIGLNDNLISLNAATNGANTKDVGLLITRGSSGSLAVVWVEADNTFALVSTSSVETDNTVTVTGYKNLKTADLTVVGSKVNFQPTAIIVGTSATAIASFSASEYRGAKYIVTVSNSPNYAITECMIVHDGTTASLITYGEILTGNNLGTFSASINSGNVELSFTGVTANNSVKVSSQLLAV